MKRITIIGWIILILTSFFLVSLVQNVVGDGQLPLEERPPEALKESPPEIMLEYEENEIFKDRESAEKEASPNQNH